MSRKISAFFIVIVMMFTFAADGCFGVRVSAAESDRTYIERILKNGLDSFSNEITFTWRCPVSDRTAAERIAGQYADSIADVFYELLNQERYFYVIEENSYTGEMNNYNIRIRLGVKYITDKKNVEKYRTAMNKAVKSIMSGVKDSWTDVQKAAYLHDTLVLRTSYVSGNAYSTPYYALVKKKALCSGYSRAYSILLQRAGIKCSLLRSDTHMWDLVTIGGKNYHVDCTNDDHFINSEQIPYNVYHGYFLKSDDSFEAEGEYTPTGLAVSDKYDDIMWDTTSPFAFYGKSIIYTDGEDVYSYDTVKGRSSKLFSVSDDWTITFKEYTETSVREYGYRWDDSFTHLASHNDKIYYNLAHSIRCYDPKTGKITSVYTNGQSDDIISAVYISGSSLYAIFRDTEETETKKTILKLG